MQVNAPTYWGHRATYCLFVYCLHLLITRLSEERGSKVKSNASFVNLLV